MGHLTRSVEDFTTVVSAVVIAGLVEIVVAVVVVVPLGVVTVVAVTIIDVDIAKYLIHTKTGKMMVSYKPMVNDQQATRMSIHSISY